MDVSEAEKWLTRTCTSLVFEESVINFLCVNCNMLAVDHYILECEHVFCGECHNRFCQMKFNCPKCQKDIEGLVVQSDRFQKNLWKLKARCPNCKYGCHEMLSLEELAVHVTTCDMSENMYQDVFESSDDSTPFATAQEEKQASTLLDCFYTRLLAIQSSLPETKYILNFKSTRTEPLAAVASSSSQETPEKVEEQGEEADKKELINRVRLALEALSKELLVNTPGYQKQHSEMSAEVKVIREQCQIIEAKLKRFHYKLKKCKKSTKLSDLILLHDLKKRESNHFEILIKEAKTSKLANEIQILIIKRAKKVLTSEANLLECCAKLVRFTQHQTQKLVDDFSHKLQVAILEVSGQLVDNASQNEDESDDEETTYAPNKFMIFRMREREMLVQMNELRNALMNKALRLKGLVKKYNEIRKRFERTFISLEEVSHLIQQIDNNF